MHALTGSLRSAARLGVAISLAFGATANWADAATVLSSGHVDIFEAEYEVVGATPELHLGVHTDEGHFEPSDVILQVNNSALTSTSGLPSPITAILGADAWILPADLEQAATLGVIEAGIGRVGVFPTADAVTFTLISAGSSNPGNFVLFNASNPNEIRMSAIGNSIGTPSFTVSQQHLHWNWGFSAPGTYTFDLQASYTDPGAGLLQSPVETYTFQVVPEPSTWAVASAVMIGAVALQRIHRGRG